MSALRIRVLVFSLLYLGSFAVAQQSDQLGARVLGPRWRQVMRSAGMVFSGTVLSVDVPVAADDQSIPTIKIKIHVDRAIAGVKAGQVIAIREWAGAWSMHNSMQPGQRVLLFLYPPSPLGLTSPVGGPLGQVRLDASGKIVATRTPRVVNVSRNMLPPTSHVALSRVPVVKTNITLRQLERAIHSAREE